MINTRLSFKKANCSGFLQVNKSFDRNWSFFPFENVICFKAVLLEDVVGPARYSDYDALIVTFETKKGGDFVNEVILKL